MSTVREATTLAEARSLLLRTRWEERRGAWVVGAEEPIDLGDDVPCSLGSLPSDIFTVHEVRALPDHPPAESESTSLVHRFVLAADAAATLNAQLSYEAHNQNLWPRSWLNGESKSNSGGFHSREEALVRGGHWEPQWYEHILAQLLLPALRRIGRDAAANSSAVAADTFEPSIALDDEVALAAAAARTRAGHRLDADGLPIGGRITGWLNVNGPQDLNHLHDHGADCAWSLVYYVRSGEGEGEATNEVDPIAFVNRMLAPAPEAAGSAAAADAPAPTAEAADEGGGTLLLKTHPEAETGRHAFLSVVPKAGELWCFPGHLLHCVMPRELERGRPSHGGPAPKRGLRVSVACNVYTTSSCFRDANIGYHGDAPTDPGLRFGGEDLRSCWGFGCVGPRK